MFHFTDNIPPFQEVNAISLDDVLVNCRVGKSSPISLLIDSGADVNIIGGSDWSVLNEQYEKGLAELQITKTTPNQELRAYATTSPMTVKCSFRAKVEIVGSSKPVVEAEFLVVNEGRRSLLGRTTAGEMRLLEVGLAVNSCETDQPEVFPKMPGVLVKFSVDRTIPPAKNAYYNVPAAYREGARRRLHDMEMQGIIERVVDAPGWISGMSAVPKGKNDFRLVVNMRSANKAIKREYYRLPLLDEIKIKLHGARYFTKLDLSNAYYHLELSKESRDLTTFLTESGMYRFTRLMFGVNCAPEIFQREMCRILEGEENIIVYIDDVLIFADSPEQLRKITCRVLEVLRKNNLTLNKAKCEFEKTHVKFLGHELDQNGFHVDEAKVRDIENFRSPTTGSELRSFLGLATYISPYIDNFANITHPLWAVSSSRTWTWGPQQQKAFEEIKHKITHCTTTLGYFSEQDRTILYTDASPDALGAVLVQQKDGNSPRIISFASKALTSTEKKYAQNQREALGAVWAIEHFSFFLLGRRFTLRTDAEGITFILNRTREDSKRALTRADGWALRLSPYNYDVEFVRGRDNIADPSSRLYVGTDEPFDEQKSPWEIACIDSNKDGFLTESEIREATQNDPTLQRVCVSLESGEWTADLSKFQAVADELSLKDGLLVRNGCAVIPEKLRDRTLELAHDGHPMVAKLKSILRERVWWPGITSDAEKWVQSCRTCAVNGKPEKPTPMRRVFAPQSVWETIALDFNGPYAKHGGISILVIVDYRSRYLIARPVKSTSFDHTKRVLEDVFSREGFPASMRSDNGPPFNSAEYKQYCAQRGIQTMFSTPLFPQQNGMVENYMKLINRAMASATDNGTKFTDELQAAVNAHNAAAHSVTGIPPEEVLMGRKIKRRLPLLDYQKADFNDDTLDAKDRKAKLLGKEREDARRGARECRVKPGDTVIIERHSRMKGESRFDPQKYTVLEETNGNLTLSSDGQIVKRHVTQTKKVGNWRSEDDDGNSVDTPGKEIQRPVRQKKQPAYLQNYVRSVGDDA